MVYMTEEDFMNHIKTQHYSKYQQFDIPYGEIDSYISWKSFQSFQTVVNGDSYEGAVQILSGACRDGKIDNIIRNIRRR